MKQYEAIIQAMRANGGYATFGQLNQTVLQIPGCKWGTKTPFASIRGIVQTRPEFFRIKPGLWGLKEAQSQIEQVFAAGPQATPAQQAFDHTYYQGLLVEIGNLRGYQTFVPSQDKNKRYFNRTLAQACTLNALPPFSYNRVLAKARMIDVVWLNQREMPSEVFEVEHTTDMHGALLRFMELRDFFVKFRIVAADARKQEFKDKLASNTFSPIEDRVDFYDYEKLSTLYTKAIEYAEAENALRST